YAFIDNLPKFLMEGNLSYDNQLYFNALYFPAQMILIIIQLVYKPLLVRMANLWADESRRKKFDLIIIAMVVLIVVVTLISIGIMAWIGIPLLGILYGIDFEQFRELSYIMLIAGGLTACIDFLYQVVTILRRQRAIVGLYLITFVFSLVVLLLMINFVGLKGAVIGYLLVMLVLFVLLLREYIVQRRAFSRM
ncbi:MAG: lipopolysaccharide biosynthesis protein, partial [Eggerthellaceae bacterium]|nr:lipopolysaccharide biosynthesis protein [Eggerthellaceae bacterium]